MKRTEQKELMITIRFAYFVNLQAGFGHKRFVFQRGNPSRVVVSKCVQIAIRPLFHQRFRLRRKISFLLHASPPFKRGNSSSPIHHAPSVHYAPSVCHAPPPLRTPLVKSNLFFNILVHPVFIVISYESDYHGYGEHSVFGC